MRRWRCRGRPWRSRTSQHNLQRDMNTRASSWWFLAPTAALLVALYASGCTTDDGAGGEGGGIAGAGGTTSPGTGGTGTTGGNGGTTGTAPGGTGGTSASEGIAFRVDGQDRSDSGASATMTDGPIPIVEIEAQASGRLLISLVKNPGPITTGTYSCADGSLISYSVQGTEYSTRQGRGTCMIEVSGFAGAGKSLRGTFSASLGNADGEKKTLSNGTFAVVVGGSD